MKNIRSKRESLIFKILSLAMITMTMNLFATDYTEYVNPLRGSKNDIRGFSHGNTYPAVGAPHGMTYLSGETRWLGDNEDGRHRWFYQRGCPVQAIRFTHSPAPWMGDYGQFDISAYHDCDLDSRNEISKPHYYSVDIFKKGDSRSYTDFSCTATERCSFVKVLFHREKTREAKEIFIDTYGYNGDFAPGVCYQDGNIYRALIGGTARKNNGGVTGDFGCRFMIEADQPFVLRNYSSSRVGLEFSNGSGLSEYQVNLKIGTSFISSLQALENLKVEIGNKTFEQVADETKEKWNKELSRIEIDPATASRDQMITFYSCIYRANLFPMTFYEVDSNGSKIHYSPYNGNSCQSGELYVGNGLWDTYRTVYPFLSIVNPEMFCKLIDGCFIQAYKEGGWVPKWTAPGYMDCMIATPFANIVADALHKGITNFDIANAYNAAWKDAVIAGNGNYGRTGISHYLNYGYVDEVTSESVSKTLEYAYSDYCTKQIEIYCKNNGFPVGKFDYKPDNWLKIYQDYDTINVNGVDKKIKFPVKRYANNGSFCGEYGIQAWGGPYTEGSAWHYVFYVPFDINRLISFTFGGDDGLIAALDKMLVTSGHDKGWRSGEIHEMSEMDACNMGQYQASNQPCHNFLYLYSFAGAPWKSAPWIRKVVDTIYSSGYDKNGNIDGKGYIGDEDNGESSCWYIFSTLGFYPVNPGYEIPYYVFGTPRFGKTTIHLPNGKDFKIIANNNSDVNIYIQSVKLNGQNYPYSYIKHNDIAQGGKLEFLMGPNPNRDFGCAPEFRPPMTR